MRLIHTCVSYVLLLSFLVYIKSKNIHFYNINKILFHQKTMMTHSCNAPIRTIQHIERMKTIKKQHSGKMKSNHHLPECDSVFFSSEKKKLKSSSAKSYSILYLVNILFRSIFIGLASNHLRKPSHFDLLAFAQLAASAEFP